MFACLCGCPVKRHELTVIRTTEGWGSIPTGECLDCGDSSPGTANCPYYREDPMTFQHALSEQTCNACYPCPCAHEDDTQAACEHCGDPILDAALMATCGHDWALYCDSDCRDAGCPECFEESVGDRYYD